MFITYSLVWGDKQQSLMIMPSFWKRGIITSNNSPKVRTLVNKLWLTLFYTLHQFFLDIRKFRKTECRKYVVTEIQYCQWMFMYTAGIKILPLELCHPRNMPALLMHWASPVCGFTLLQHVVLQQPLVCKVLDCVWFPSGEKWYWYKGCFFFNLRWAIKKRQIDIT